MQRFLAVSENLNERIMRREIMSGRVGGYGWDQSKKRNTYVRYRSDMPDEIMGVRAEDAPSERRTLSSGVPISDLTRQAEALLKLGLKFVPENQRPKSPCSNCGKSVTAGANTCSHCGYNGFTWNCNSCGGVMDMTLIGLLFCVRCKGFWH